MTKNKSMLNPYQKLQFYIIRVIGNYYTVFTGKTEYKISFKILNRKYRIEKKYIPGCANTENVEGVEIERYRE